MHTIRLGPPWEVTISESGARHTRKFGRPRTIDANERVWLVCEHVPGAAVIYVNGANAGAIDAPGSFTTDITALLQSRNELAIAVVCASQIGSVLLEIRTV